MVQFIVQSSLLEEASLVELDEDECLVSLYERVSAQSGVSRGDFLLRTTGGEALLASETVCSLLAHSQREESEDEDAFVMVELVVGVQGGIDFQHREGGKTGSGGQLSESQAALERKERLRKLALETIDISKDPYFFKNHLGTFECKLCLTLHPNEGNYLAHTQGKRHQYNIGRRAAMEAKNAAPKVLEAEPQKPLVKRVIKIGRPGYKVSCATILSVSVSLSLSSSLSFSLPLSLLPPLFGIVTLKIGKIPDDSQYHSFPSCARFLRLNSFILKQFPSLIPSLYSCLLRR